MVPFVPHLRTAWKSSRDGGMLVFYAAARADFRG